MRENCTYGSMRGRAYPITRGVPLYSTHSVYVLLYMLDGGESEVMGSAADCAADLVYYTADDGIHI